ncbi:stage II sporulation protein P [Shouchella sp. 1P09AA]|uniref:stage II sporulation protein P n=1 Tax=unclassified Shouchella TaxID=2893065 RepID=UPI0039A1DE45
MKAGEAMHKWLVASLLFFPYFLSGETIEQHVDEVKPIDHLWTSSSIEYDYHVGEDLISKAYSTLITDDEDQARILIEIDTSVVNGDVLLSVAEELHQELEQTQPGLSRGIFARSDGKAQGDENINLYIGGVENTDEELETTVELVKNIIHQMN